MLGDEAKTNKEENRGTIIISISYWSRFTTLNTDHKLLLYQQTIAPI